MILKQEIARETLSGNQKFRISRLPFSDIPHQSRLFLDYLRDPLSLKEFYPNAVTSPAKIASYAPIVLEKYSTDRSDLCDALTETNLRINAGEKSLRNIELLRNGGTVAVVTGQQAGLFTGPLYTIYKALSAVKLAGDLTRKGSPAVPVFWAATEDHDFDEVAEAFSTGNDGELFRSSYKPHGYMQDSPVGNVKIDGEINVVIDQMFAELPATEFSASMRDLISQQWQSGEFFGEAFFKTLAQLLGKYGTVFIDPQSDAIKRLSFKIYIDSIRNADAIVAGIKEQDRKLASKAYHSQVLVEDDYFPLFWHDDTGRRTALRKSGDGVYRVKGDRREFAIAELESIARDEPQRFSPGVMLRPVVQDFLLPTVCYFGGGAEVAYFAQNSAVYNVLNRPVTPVFHRQSFTTVEPRHRRVLDKYDLRIPRLFDGLEKITLEISADNLGSATATLFAEVGEKINTELNRIDQALSQIDTTLNDNLSKRRRKMLYHIAALRKKALLAQVRNDETLSRQLSGLFTNILPRGELQERSLNVFTYLNKFGPNFIDWIYDAIDLDDKDHRIIDL